LFGINVDGTDQALYVDPRGERIKRMPCITDRGLVIFIESEPGGDGSGQISAVTFRRPLRTYHRITLPEDGFAYRYPSPAPQGGVLVSRRSRKGAPSYGIWRFDPRKKTAELVWDDPRYEEAQAHAVRVRPTPDGRSTSVEEQHATGKLYCLNSNWDDFEDRTWHPPGTARRVRLLEGIPVAGNASDAWLSSDDQPAHLPGATVNGLPPMVQRRVLGELDISPDGSFHVEVPANIPIQLQTLDEHGVVLRTCGWIWAKNREWRGCIGCHEDGELTPENYMTESLRGRAVDLTLPPERRRTVDFRRDLMPVIEAKCVPCHGAEGAEPRLDGGLQSVAETDGGARFNRAYSNLLARRPAVDERSYGGLFVDPGRARTSRLIWHVYGRNLARPWDGEMGEETAEPIPEGGPQLPELERRLFAQWVDMGALWNGIPPDQER